jgi:hypothetical protein
MEFPAEIWGEHAHIPVMSRPTLTAFGILLIAASTAWPASAAPPVNRWGLDYNRASRPPRASDPFVHRPPVRVYRKAKPPAVDTELPPSPRYGKPKPAIERIPGT